jgi:5-formyltetrahydrofolate cyclo-ligase
MTKEELRKIYLQKRLALSEGEYSNLNRSLASNLISNIDLSGTRVLHTFLPIQKTKEPNTWLLIDEVKARHPSVQVSVPRINNQNSSLDNFFLESSAQLQPNIWGIPEPKEGKPTPTDQIDVVLVPLLAFDVKGNRVGYGRGFYDKFLATLKESCLKIGLSFFPPVSNISNLHPMDLPLDAAITPTEVFKFRN